MITLLGKLKANACFEYKATVKWVNTVKKKKSVYLSNSGMPDKAF